MPTYEFARPALACDMVVLGGSAEDRRVLLIRRRYAPFEGMYALPGGFVEEGERLEAAALRELAEETGIELEGPLVQLGAYGDPGRDPRGWTVGVAWLADVGPGLPTLRAGDDAAAAEWIGVGVLPPLAFDHNDIVADALALTRVAGRD